MQLSGTLDRMETVMKQQKPSPRIVRISWGRMEIEGLGAGKDFKLYPGGGLPGPAAAAAETAPGAAQGRRLAARRACRTRTGTSPAIVIRRGRHHLPQPAKSRPPFSCSSACRLNPVIRFAIGRRQVTMTDRDEQPVIGSLQSALPANSVLPGGWLDHRRKQRRVA